MVRIIPEDHKYDTAKNPKGYASHDCERRAVDYDCDGHLSKHMTSCQVVKLSVEACLLVVVGREVAKLTGLLADGSKKSLL